jgi:hypothetical protein
MDNVHRLTQLTELVQELKLAQSRFGRELAKPNIFVSAGLLLQETRHSTILSFLLNPKEWHGLGDHFLSEILSLVSKGRTDSLQIALAKLEDVRVDREITIGGEGDTRTGRLDILVDSRNDGLLLAIENKTSSKQGDNQLSRYKNWINNKYSHKQHKILVFLTVDSEAPDDEEWTILTYSELITVLKDVAEAKKHALSDYGQTFIDNYIDLVRRFIVKEENEDLKRISKDLWDRFGEVLDKISEYRPTPFIDAANNFMSDHNLEMVALRNGVLYFSAAQVVGVELDSDEMSEKNFYGWGRMNQAILFSIQLTGDKIRIALTIGPLNDLDKRRNYVSSFKSSGVIAHSGKIRDQTTRFTRVWGYHEEKLMESDDPLDSESIRLSMNKLWKKFNEPLRNELKRILLCWKSL